MRQRALDHRVVERQSLKLLFERAAVDADAYRDAALFEECGEIFHVLFVADVARIDAYLRRARLRRGDREPIVEMYVGYDGHVAAFDDLFEGIRARLVGD